MSDVKQLKAKRDLAKMQHASFQSAETKAALDAATKAYNAALDAQDGKTAAPVEATKLKPTTPTTPRAPKKDLAPTTPAAPVAPVAPAAPVNTPEDTQPKQEPTSTQEGETSDPAGDQIGADALTGTESGASEGESEEKKNQE